MNTASGILDTKVLGSSVRRFESNIATIPRVSSGSGTDVEEDDGGKKKCCARRRKPFVKSFRPEYNYALGEYVGWEMIM